jgi:hypothetical protein
MVLKIQHRPFNAGIPGGKVEQLEVAPSLLEIRIVVTTDEVSKSDVKNKRD